jgi:hypothetical protein
MTDALVIAALGLIITLFLAIVVLILRSVLGLRPFDYRRLANQTSGLMVSILLLLLMAVSLDEQSLPQPDVQGALIAVGLIVFVYFSQRSGLRQLSDYYARREQKLAEKRQRRSEEQLGRVRHWEQ